MQNYEFHNNLLFGFSGGYYQLQFFGSNPRHRQGCRSPFLLYAWCNFGATSIEIKDNIVKLRNFITPIGGGLKEVLHRCGGFAGFFESVGCAFPSPSLRTGESHRGCLFVWVRRVIYVGGSFSGFFELGKFLFVHR
jgi:hypothetical protein